MTMIADIRASEAAERVLIVANAATAEPLAAELARRGASVSAAAGIGQAAAALRLAAFDIVIVAARANAEATTLLIGLARAETRGKANIMLLIDPEEAERYGAAIFEADEIIGVAMSPKRIAEATGVGQRC